MRRRLRRNYDIPLIEGDETVTDMLAEDPDAAAADVRELRHRIAVELSRELTEGEIARVAEIAHVILGMTVPERACLGALLREVQNDATLEYVQPPENVWPDRDVPFQ